MGRYTAFYNADFTTAQVEALRALNATELGYVNNITPGIAAASKAIIIDANKDVGGVRGFAAVNFDAGGSGTAGTFDLFPATAAKGKVTFAASDNTGDTLTTLSFAGQAAIRTITIPDLSTKASTDSFNLAGFITGTGAPSSKPGTFGLLYIDTANGKVYTVTTASATAATWALIGTQS